MNRYQYIAYNNPRGASEVVHRFGMRPIRNPHVLSRQLAKVVADHREEGATAVADIHPDLPFFQAKLDGYKAKYKKEHSNACGCGCDSCSNFSNANGQQLKSDVTKEKTGENKTD